MFKYALTTLSHFLIWKNINNNRKIIKNYKNIDNNSGKNSNISNNNINIHNNTTTTTTTTSSSGTRGFLVELPCRWCTRWSWRPCQPAEICTQNYTMKKDKIPWTLSNIKENNNLNASQTEALIGKISSIYENRSTHVFNQLSVQKSCQYSYRYLVYKNEQ